MSRKIWVWDEGHGGAMICVAHDRQEAIDKLAGHEMWEFVSEEDHGRLVSYELDEVVTTTGYQP